MGRSLLLHRKNRGERMLVMNKNGLLRTSLIQVEKLPFFAQCGPIMVLQANLNKNGPRRKDVSH